MSYKLAADNIEEILNKITIYKQEDAEITTGIQIGNEIIGSSDFKKILNSDYIIIPVIISVSEVYKEEYITVESILNTVFFIIDINEEEIYKQIDITIREASGSPDSAYELVLKSFAEELDIELQKAFSIVIEVIGIRNNEIDISVKEGSGIKQGYELIYENENSEETVLVVKDTGEKTSIAALLYGPVVKNSFFKKLPRAGFELTPFYSMTIDNLNDFDIYSTLGLRASWTKGLYTVRPFISFEFPMPFTGSYVKWLYDNGTPFITYYGFEFSLILRRLQMLTQASFGTHFFIPSRVEEDQKRYLTHLGGFVNTSFSFLISKRLKFCVDIGYRIWGCPYDSLFGEEDKKLYGGITIGTGLTVKL